MQRIIIFLFSFILFTATLTSTNNQQTQPFITEPSSLTPWQGSRSCMSKNTQKQMLPTSDDMVVKLTFHDMSFDCLSTCLSLRQRRPACDWDGDLRRWCYTHWVSNRRRMTIDKSTFPENSQKTILSLGSAIWSSKWCPVTLLSLRQRRPDCDWDEEASLGATLGFQ